MVFFAGADPGFSGAIALLTEDGCDIERIYPVKTWNYFSPTEMKKKDPKKRKFRKMLDTSDLADTFKRLDTMHPVYLALENVSARGNDAAITAWQLGGSFMAMQQAIVTTDIKLIDLNLCLPMKWKAIYPLLHKAGAGNTDVNSRKKVVDAAAIATVQEVFPNSWQKICPPHKSRKGVFNSPNPNWADAALLANYAKYVYENSLSMTTAKVA